MGRASIAYTNKDYESLRRELLGRVPQLTDRWTDFNSSDLGIVLLELFCGVGDMLAYYLDAQAAEAFLPTARQRQNVIQLCKLIGYRLDAPVAATTTLRLSVAAPLVADLVIPARTTASARLDDVDVEFETVVGAILPRDRMSVDVNARQGRRKVETFAATGEPNGSFPLAGTEIAQGSLSVLIDDRAWREVHHFQESGAEDEHFQAETDGLDRTRILFGDGVRGVVPAADAAIRVEYVETQGAKGNLGTGIVTELTSTLYQDGELVVVTVTNPVPATGGADRESLDHARRQAPAEVRAVWKALTKDDYRALAEGYPGVAKAQVLDANDSAGIRYYQVNLAVAPQGGGPPSALLKRDLAAFLESRKVITIEINLFEPVYRQVAIDADAHVYAGEDLEVVRRRIEQALADYFDFEHMDFGRAVPTSDLIALLDGVRGVSHAHLFTPLAVAETQRREIREAIEIYRRKGTLPAIGRALADHGWRGRIEETFRHALRLNRRAVVGRSKLPGSIYSLGAYRVGSDTVIPGLRDRLAFHHPAGTRAFFMQWLALLMSVGSQIDVFSKERVRRIALGHLHETFVLSSNALNGSHRLTRTEKTWGLWWVTVGNALLHEVERAGVCIRRWHGRNPRFRLNGSTLNGEQLPNVWISERRLAICCTVDTRGEPTQAATFIRLAGQDLNRARLNRSAPACTVQFRQKDDYAEVQAGFTSAANLFTATQWPAAA